MEENYSDWIMIRAVAKTENLDRLTAIMSAVEESLMIEDYSDFNLNGMYGELADEKILNADRSVASVSLFLPDGEDPAEKLAFIRSRLACEGIEATVMTEKVNEREWVNEWKKYYRPLHIGEKTVICPRWEKYEPAEGEIVVTMDPGMAFGSGSHETTRAVIGLLEKVISGGEKVLDVGTGSGILGICAMKYGAGLCRAYDIDPIAAEVAAENFALNGVAGETGVADLLRGVKKDRYDVICANIVADIILRLLPDLKPYTTPGCRVLLSGIITERAAEIEAALDAASLVPVKRVDDNGWTAFLATSK